MGGRVDILEKVKSMLIPEHEFFFCYKIKVKVKSLSHARLFVTPWTVAYQAPLSIGFPRQESWSEWSLPSPGDLPNPGVKPRSPALQADSLLSEPPGKPKNIYVCIIN